MNKRKTSTKGVQLWGGGNHGGKNKQTRRERKRTTKRQGEKSKKDKILRRVIVKDARFSSTSIDEWDDIDLIRHDFVV